MGSQDILKKVSVILSPTPMWQMATTSESQQLFIMCVIIFQCVFP